MDRRLLLSLIAGTVALPQIVRAVPLPPPQPHRLNLLNAHTGEKFSGIYRDDNGAIPRVMDDLSVFLRDFHSGEKIGIDVELLDFLSGVLQTVGENKATILSAYRTPETNAMLAKKGFKPAENSLHLYGRALDVHISDKLSEAMKTARAMQRGGVGWYPHSNFMHIDTGPVRNWDLDQKERGTLLVGNKKVRFDKKGNILVAKGKASVGVKTPTVLRGEAPLSVRDRLARLRTLARAQYAARGR
jgi:uncharacterized protein YcbK (DUF882 family)